MLDDLRACFLLNRLPDALLARVQQRARRLTLHEGANLFSQGDPADRFFLVTQGHIKLFRISPDGHEKVIQIIGAGRLFAEALMFLDRPNYPVGAMALNEVKLISLDAADFKAMLRDSIDTCFLLLGGMSQRLHDLIHEIDELSLQSATRRVSSYLLKLAENEGENIHLDIPKGVVASRLSVKPETFSRIIKGMSEAGIISVQAANIRILDLHALRNQAGGCI
ncbi:CRP/FNR family transcriptional regulator, dissimilatory nitrate respiration regulator [Gammaproteobacteria bacterium]